MASHCSGNLDELELIDNRCTNPCRPHFRSVPYSWYSISCLCPFIFSLPISLSPPSLYSLFCLPLVRVCLQCLSVQGESPSPLFLFQKLDAKRYCPPSSLTSKPLAPPHQSASPSPFPAPTLTPKRLARYEGVGRRTSRDWPFVLLPAAPRGLLTGARSALFLKHLSKPLIS